MVANRDTKSIVCAFDCYLYVQIGIFGALQWQREKRREPKWKTKISPKSNGMRTEINITGLWNGNRIDPLFMWDVLCIARKLTFAHTTEMEVSGVSFCHHTNYRIMPMMNNTSISNVLNNLWGQTYRQFQPLKTVWLLENSENEERRRAKKNKKAHKCCVEEAAALDRMCQPKSI